MIILMHFKLAMILTIGLFIVSLFNRGPIWLCRIADFISVGAGRALARDPINAIIIIVFMMFYAFILRVITNIFWDEPTSHLIYGFVMIISIVYTALFVPDYRNLTEKEQEHTSSNVSFPREKSTARDGAIIATGAYGASKLSGTYDDEDMYSSYKGRSDSFHKKCAAEKRQLSVILNC